MTKVDFITRLNRAIDVLPYEDRKEILADYEEHFRVGFENGKTESEICESLGVPEELAADYYAEGSSAAHSQDGSYYDGSNPFFVTGQGGAYAVPYPQDAAKKNKETAKKVLTVLGMLLFMLFIVVPLLGLMIGLFFGLLGILVALYAAAAAVIVAAIALYPNGTLLFGGILIGVGVLAGAILATLAVSVVAKGLVKMGKYIVKSCVNIIKKA
ncbi:MAG: DUF1700 domain-containing protein [Oscillospiraceae bacterium]|jgi:uncharacterized membrane protein|nr:DUF1700 domain-containing protein [Oscillospiraceae bacterium]